MFGDPEAGLNAAGDVTDSLDRQIKFRGITNSTRSSDSIRALLAVSQDEGDNSSKE